MTNTATATKISDKDLKESLKNNKDNVLERYLECPVCGNEPFPGCNGIRPGQVVPLPIGYFCPKCLSITLIIAIRIRKEFLHLFESATDGGRQGDIQNRIDAEEEKEMTARQKMLSIIDTTLLYRKIYTIKAALKRRGGRKNKT